MVHSARAVPSGRDAAGVPRARSPPGGLSPLHRGQLQPLESAAYRHRSPSGAGSPSAHSCRHRWETPGPTQAAPDPKRRGKALSRGVAGLGRAGNWPQTTQVEQRVPTCPSEWSLGRGAHDRWATQRARHLLSSVPRAPPRALFRAPSRALTSAGQHAGLSQWGSRGFSFPPPERPLGTLPGSLQTSVPSRL